MTTKKTLGALALVVALVAAALFVRSRHQTRGVRIGVVLPLSGSMAEYGENGREGLTLAAAELSSQYGIKEFELTYQDSREAPQDTVQAVRRLIDVDHVQFIIGGLTSSGVLAAAPYAQQHAVLFFTPAASAPGIPEIGDLVFRNWPGDDLIAREFGQAAHDELKVQKVAILSVSNDYGNTNATYFAKTFSAKGGIVLLRRAFSQGTTDFRPLLTEVGALQGLDKLFLVAYPDEYRAIFPEIAASRIRKGSILVSDTFYSPQLLSQLGSSAEGTVCAVAAKPGEDYKPRQQFIAAYRARFKTRDGKPKDPGLVSDTAYDALKLVMTGISETDGSPKAVAKWLHKLRNYPGAAGPVTFGETGDIKGELALFEVVSGKFVARNF
jgi:branched-chain amino acid transport system substrate-binding protein